MQRSKALLFLPLIVGSVLMVLAWWSSYPLNIYSVDDYLFNHLSILYWVSMPLLLASLYMISVSFRNSTLKWLAVLGMMFTIYSMSYFYYMLPGSDSQAFRGLTEYFIKTKNLDTSLTYHSYFQWPSFFILNDIATAVSGMQLMSFEFLTYGIIGFLLTTGLYVYASRRYKNEGFLAVAMFFVAMSYFLNYQAVPFSFAFGLLFLLLPLETREKNFSVMLMELALFVGITFFHSFVPLFFILYLLIQFLLSRNRQYGRLLLITSAIYLVVQIAQGGQLFFENIRTVLTVSSEYSAIVMSVLAPVSVPLDQIAQLGSRGVTFGVVLICLAGSAVLLTTRKLKDVDKSIFLTGFFYFVFGLAYFALGSRAIPLMFITISLGSAYLLRSRIGRYLKPVFLILLVLFVSVPLHGSFGGSQIFFQTKEGYQTVNFFIDHYDWTIPSLLLGHYRVLTYIEAKQPANTTFEGDVYSPLFPRMKEYDTILYTTGLGINLLKYNYTADTIASDMYLNVIYNSGLSFSAVKSWNSTSTRVR